MNENEEPSDHDLKLWIDGFISGCECGIKHAARILMDVGKKDAPVSEEAKRALEQFGKALFRQAVRMAAVSLDVDDK